MSHAGVGSSPRAGRSARRIVRAATRHAFRRNWRVLSAFLLGWTVLAVATGPLIRVMGGSPWASGFSVGLWFGVMPVLWQAFVTSQGLAHRMMGVDAEEWTGSELNKLDARHWRVFHDVPLQRGNVDHVVVGSRRLYAIETKWVSGEPTHYGLKRLVGITAHRAKALEIGIRQSGVPRRVTPLLVLWGPGVRDAVPERGQRLEPEAVTVVAGVHASHWLGRMDDAARGLELDLPAIRAVESLRQSARS